MKRLCKAHIILTFLGPATRRRSSSFSTRRINFRDFSPPSGRRWRLLRKRLILNRSSSSVSVLNSSGSPSPPSEAPSQSVCIAVEGCGATGGEEEAMISTSAGGESRGICARSMIIGPFGMIAAGRRRAGGGKRAEEGFIPYEGRVRCGGRKGGDEGENEISKSRRNPEKKTPTDMLPLQSPPQKRSNVSTCLWRGACPIYAHVLASVHSTWPTQLVRPPSI